MKKISFSYVENNIISQFINKYDHKYSKKLTSYFNFSRVACLADFKAVLNTENLSHFSKVAVVSGSKSDPELDLLNFDQLDILDYEPLTDRYNLENVWSEADSVKEGEYDFTLCNQVLEHIYTPTQGLRNLYYVTRPGGYVWVSVPTINCIHGEPYFYSSGYHPRYLARLGADCGFQVVHVGAWGSRKYISAAVLGRWLTHNQLKLGFHTKQDFLSPLYAFKDGRLNDITGKNISDTWALFRRPV